MTIGSSCVRQRAIVCVYVVATTIGFESCARERAVLCVCMCAAMDGLCARERAALCVCACVWLWIVSNDTIGFEVCGGENSI